MALYCFVLWIITGFVVASLLLAFTDAWLGHRMLAAWTARAAVGGAVLWTALVLMGMSVELIYGTVCVKRCFGLAAESAVPPQNDRNLLILNKKMTLWNPQYIRSGGKGTQS